MKWLVGAAIAIPSIAAAIEAALFGISFNNSVVMPFVKPRIGCHNVKQDGTEGGYLVYKTTITAKRPIYLEILWSGLSMPYQLNLEADKGYSFNEVGDLSNSNGLTVIERRFSSEAHIAKSIHFFHRFIKEPAYQFFVMASGPTPLLEDECPFAYSVRY